MKEFDAIYYSETLNKDLVLDITFVDSEPESNYYMFEFDALDGNVDRKEQLTQKEWDDCEQIIYKYLRGLL